VTDDYVKAILDRVADGDRREREKREAEDVARRAAVQAAYDYILGTGRGLEDVIKNDAA
jgi:hypothetical protein